jgi:hypothetical protein
MNDIDKLKCDLLLNEKNHVDDQIASFMDLQIKILTFLFPALGVALGWIFKQGNMLGPERAVILVGAVISACFGTLLSIGTYATALAYVYYKHVVLSKKFQEILNLPTSPFGTKVWSSSPGGKVLTLATGGTWLLVFLFNVWLLVAAWRCGNTSSIHILVLLSASLVIVTAAIALRLAGTIRKTSSLP